MRFKANFHPTVGVIVVVETMADNLYAAKLIFEAQYGAKKVDGFRPA